MNKVTPDIGLTGCVEFWCGCVGWARVYFPRYSEFETRTDALEDKDFITRQLPVHLQRITKAVGKEVAEMSPRLTTGASPRRTGGAPRKSGRGESGKRQAERSCVR